MVLRINTGYSPDYLLKEVAKGRENYYTGAVAEGEPPGRWWGAGAEKLGLAGQVDAQDMRAVYERFLDPRAAGFNDPNQWDEVGTLGHTGRNYQSEDDLYNAALEQEPGASAERRAELRTEAGKNARHNVAFFDITFNVQKSVTLLHTAFEAEEVKARAAGDFDGAAAWGEFRNAVEDAIWAGNNAALAYMQDRAGYTRVGRHGGAAGRWADAHAWVVASFFQHDSREHDPHLHIHNALLNRVEGPDGEWLTVDGRSLYRWRAAGAAVAERTTAERLTHTIGMIVAMRPDGKAREVVGVSQAAMDLISTRSRKLTAKAAELIAAHEARTGVEANGLVRERLTQQATLLTRSAKTHTGETREQLLDRIDSRIRGDIDGGLAGIARAALAARGQALPALQEWSPQAVIETALADVQGRRSGWNDADFIAAIDAALPNHLGLPDGHDVATLIDGLAAAGLEWVTSLDTARPGDAQLPGSLRLQNGDSAYQQPGGRLYATPEHVQTERALVAASTTGGAAALRHEVARRFLTGLAESGIHLGVDQAAAVRGVLTSGAAVETLIGPPGTGKSFVVGTIARGWTDPTLQTTAGATGRVFGLATSQIATEVLAAEGLTARNVAAWLGTQRRLAASPGGGGPRPVDGDRPWRLRAGDLVVVDESAMTDTAALAAIWDYVQAAGAKLLLVGDHRQLASVGAGGLMDLLSHTGASYELAEARRFHHGWERDASLRLRAGDETVLRTYHQQGRLLDAGTVEEAEASAARAWLGDTLAGRRSLLVVDTNEQAARVSAGIRAELVRLGHVTEDGVLLGLQGTYAGVGDLVEARAIAWDLAGHEGNPRGPINREHFRVHAVRPDGSLEVAAITGRSPDGDVLGDRLVLPPSYVAEHLALGYASTVHAVQGGTVDTTHTVATPHTTPAALLVGVTRGADANTVHVVTRVGVDDPAQGTERHTMHRDPVAALARILDTTDTADAANRSAVATAADGAAHAGSVRTAAELLADAAQLAATERTATWLDQLTDDGAIAPQDRARIAAEDGAATLTRILRRAELAGHNPHAVLTDAVGVSSFDGARNLSNVLYSRIRAEYRDRLDPIGDTFADWVPQVDNPDWRDYLNALAAAADDRVAELGRDIAEEGAPWAVDTFGPIPTDAVERAEWEAKAGAVAAVRELSGHDDPTEALGRAPGAGQVENYAAYRAAWRILGRPDFERDVMQLSDGQLRARVRAWEREQPWGPRYVGNELAGTRQAAATRRHTAALRAAEADAATDPAQQARLRVEAAQATALAAALDREAEQLQLVDDARARWLAHGAVTRAEAMVCQAELSRRHVDDTAPEQLVTGPEWLDAHRATTAAEDSDRAITEHDIHDDTADQADAIDTRTVDPAGGVIDVAPPDIRDVAAQEPAQRDEDRVWVPPADDAAASVAGAARTIAEITARNLADQQREEEERSAELARWHDDDRAGTDDHTDNRGAEDDYGYGGDGGYGPAALERNPIGAGGA